MGFRDEDGEFDAVKLTGYIPVTVVVFAVITWYFITNGVGYSYVRPDVATALNPLLYLGGLFFHTDMAHYWGNMRLFVPFGILLTWLTNNRHVLGVVFISHILASITRVGIGLSLGILSVGVGSSLAVFGIMSATIVRLTGVMMQNSTKEMLIGMVFGVMTVFMLALFALTLSAGNTVTDHLGHSLGFLFGGAFEAMYVFDEHEERMQEEKETADYEFMHQKR